MATVKIRTARKEWKCQRCGATISPGDKYRVVSRRYAGKIIRCMGAECEIKRWELTSSDKLAELYRIEDELSCLDPYVYDPHSLATDVTGYAEQVREVAEQYRESATNIEDGFGHETFMSQELNDKADEVESWADDLENAAGAIEDIEVVCDCGHKESDHHEVDASRADDLKVWFCSSCEDEHGYEEDPAWADEAFSLLGDVSSSPL